MLIHFSSSILCTREIGIYWGALPAAESSFDVEEKARIEELFDDLRRAGITYRPHIWLSTDWFTPDGVIGFAVPFFLAHRRLARR